LNPPAAMKRRDDFEDRGSHRAPLTSAGYFNSSISRNQARTASNAANQGATAGFAVICCSARAYT